MNTDALETIRTIAWSAVFIVAIISFHTYCLVRLFVTGKRLFEARPLPSIMDHRRGPRQEDLG